MRKKAGWEREFEIRPFWKNHRVLARIYGLCFMLLFPLILLGFFSIGLIRFFIGSLFDEIIDGIEVFKIAFVVTFTNRGK